MAYKHLTFIKRCRIYGLWRSGHNQTEIAKEIGVHKSTISREFKRNIFWWGSRILQYKPDYAHSYTDNRHKRKSKQIKFNKEVEAFVREKLLEDWSPKRNGPIRNRRFIDERPSIVDKKTRIGDWEIDTIIGKNRKDSVVSIVERKSKFTLLKKIRARTAEQVTRVAIRALKPFLSHVHTITGDNGSEFAYHEKISEKLKADFYFAHPYSSWERGLNENTNGLVRQHLKKG